MSAGLRALFPPLDLRLLRFRGGWAGLPIFLVMTVVYPVSLQQADWVLVSEQFVWIALAAVVVGTIAGNRHGSRLGALALGAAAGAAVVVFATVAASGEAPFRERAVKLGIDVNTWLTQVLAGEAARGQSVFTLFLGASVWAAAYVGSFVLSRTARPWDALLLSGACLTLNVSLALTPLLLDLVVFTLCALVLLVRLHIVSLQERWQRRNIQPSGEMDWRVLRGGLTWTTVLVILALVTPRVGAAQTLDTAFNVFEAPYQRVETEWQRFFAGVTGPSRLRGLTFADTIRLGQSPTLTDSVVMRVRSPEGRFWRAAAYDFYTGQGWRSTELDRTDKVNADRDFMRQPLTVAFQMVEPYGNRLFGANEPVRASVPVQFSVGDERSFSSSMRSLEQISSSQTYTVTSLVSVADKNSLRKVPQAYPEAIRRTYLQIASTLPQRVKDLTFRVVEGKANAYDRAEAIESYLRSNYRYSTAVKPPPPGRDPVDWFLFDLKEDFCEYFASSMVMMLRVAGIPARLVEGFTSGSYDPNTDSYVVKQVNAHAWVEAYFPGYGWIEFEPTPSETVFPRQELPIDLSVGGERSSGDPATSGDPSQRLLEKDLELGGSLDTASGAAPGDLPVDPRPALAALVALLLGLLGLVVRFEWRFRGRTPIQAAWGKAQLLAAYAGHPPGPSDTTYEFAASLGSAIPAVRDPIRAIADARVREVYAPRGASDDDRERAEAAWWEVARQLLALLPQRLLRAVARTLPR